MTTHEQKPRKTPVIKVQEVSDLSPHSKAMYEAGKTLLVNSINTSRDFAKFMISVSTGAIPVYLGLLKFVLPENYTLGLWDGILAVTPAIVFLVASIVFTLAYFPTTDYFSLDIIEEIEKVHKTTIKRRNRYTTSGFVVFLCGNALGILVVTLNL
jgi:hypothetical protein